MSFLTRGQKTQVRLGCVAALLVPLICKNQETAYCHALHSTLAKTHGERYSIGDVSRALKLLVTQNVLVPVTEDETKPNSRVFFQPTWLAGTFIAAVTPQWDWPDYC